MKIIFDIFSIIILCTLTSVSLAQESKFDNVEEAIANPDQATKLTISSEVDSLPSEILACEKLESICFVSLNSSFDLDAALLTISKLPNLTKVEFWDLNEAEPPMNLEHLKQVRHIEFYRSHSLKLDQYFERLKSLPKLDQLTLRWMYLTELPDEIVQLKKLKYLNLDINPELDLPQALSTLSRMKLTELNLSSAKFDVIPMEMSQLKSLKKLTLEMIQGDFNNEESYTVLSKMKKLESLNVQGNFFGAFDPSIARLRKLKRIEVDGNCLNDVEFEKLKSYLPKTDIQNEIPC